MKTTYTVTVTGTRRRTVGGSEEWEAAGSPLIELSLATEAEARGEFGRIDLAALFADDVAASERSRYLRDSGLLAELSRVDEGEEGDPDPLLWESELLDAGAYTYDDWAAARDAE